MRWSFLVSTLVIGSIPCVAASEQVRSIEVSVWPISQTHSTPLATIDYNSTIATVKSSKNTDFPTSEGLVRVGYTQPQTKAWSGVVTSASSFGNDKEKTILIRLDVDGELYHIGFKSQDLPRSKLAAGDSAGAWKAEVVKTLPGPVVYLNKPVVLNAEGEMEKPPEKTFLQKYWWAIAAFLLLQVVLGGGGGDKKE